MNWFKHHDVDPADILMLIVAVICGIPAFIFAGFGVYSTISSISTSIMASLV